MKIAKITLIIFFSLGFSQLKSDEKTEEFKNKILKNIRCLICQGQSVYDSEPDFATESVEPTRRHHEIVTSCIACDCPRHARWRPRRGCRSRSRVPACRARHSRRVSVRVRTRERSRSPPWCGWDRNASPSRPSRLRRKLRKGTRTRTLSPRNSPGNPSQENNPRRTRAWTLVEESTAWANPSTKV